MAIYCTLFVVADSKRLAILSGEDCSYALFSTVAYKPVPPQSDGLAGIGRENAVGVCGFLRAEGAGVEPAEPVRVNGL